jgi:hypothetical protein
MAEVKEKEAVDSLLRLLGKFLKVSGRKREELARDIDDFTSFELMEYNEGYERFSEELKEIMDSLLFFHRWKGSGVKYGKELFIGTRDVREMVKRLKKIRAGL